MADQLGDARLRNAVIDKTVSELAKCGRDGKALSSFPPELTTRVWDNTTIDRPLRRVVLDYYASSVLSEELRDRMDEFEAGFLKDFMMLAVVNYEENADFNYTPQEMVGCYSLCYYHEHDEQCPSCSHK